MAGDPSRSHLAGRAARDPARDRGRRGGELPPARRGGRGLSVERTLTLIGKPDCHLCHVMEDAVAPLLAARGIRLVVRDVREDPELLRRFRNDIPVLLEGDVELARHRVTPEELLKKLGESGDKPQRHRDTENGKRETD